MSATFAAALEALHQIAHLQVLSMLVAGVCIGLVVGVLPGIGGLAGLTLLMTVTIGMDAPSALALLIGMHSVIATADAIPAVLLGVPGGVGSAATVLDGHPMAQRGEAARALGASFAASMLGGVFGAILLVVSIPVLRPVILSVGTPEMFALCVLGLSLSAALSGKHILPGLALACLGLLLATVGQDHQTGTLRFDFGTLYLWDGIPLVPFSLGLFALPELTSLAIERRTIAAQRPKDRSTQLTGLRDVLAHPVVLLRSSVIGSVLGAMPGIGSAVIDWIAYGSVVRSKVPNAHFGRGDVRGVIASEAANNAKEGGALIPTIAFGVPGSAAMSILIGAFLMHGIVPGPAMLSENLDITYVMVICLALANVLGAGLCFLLAPALAAATLAPVGVLVPIITGTVLLGALQGTGQWGDLAVLLGAGLLGHILRLLEWPRAPLVLGLVLGTLVERYLATSIQIYDATFLTRPVVVILLVLALMGFLRQLWRFRVQSGQPRAPRPASARIAAVLLGGTMLSSIMMTPGWDNAARIMPLGAAIFGGIMLLLFVTTRAGVDDRHDMVVDVPLSNPDGIVESLRSSVGFFAWFVAAMACAFLLGPEAGIPLWMGAYMWVGFGLSVWRAATIAVIQWLVIVLLFGVLLKTTFPSGLL